MAVVTRRRELVCWYMHWRADGTIDRHYREVERVDQPQDAPATVKRGVGSEKQGSLL